MLRLCCCLSIQDGLLQPSQSVNNFHSRGPARDSRGSSPGRQGAEGSTTKAPLSKTVSASGVETRKLAVPESRPSGAEGKDPTKRDKLAEEVERIAVGLQ